MHIICAIGLASFTYFDGASAASNTPEVDAKEEELYMSLPQVDFNTLGDQGELALVTRETPKNPVWGLETPKSWISPF
jgi:hypothetical protein